MDSNKFDCGQEFLIETDNHDQSVCIRQIVRVDSVNMILRYLLHEKLH